MNIAPPQQPFRGSGAFAAPCVPNVSGSWCTYKVGLAVFRRSILFCCGLVFIFLLLLALIVRKMKTYSLLPLLSLALIANATTQRQTTLAFNQLQTWYNESIGLWIPSTGWWNSANCLTVVADLAQINPVVAAAAQDIYSNTYTEAQEYNLALQKTVETNTFLIHSHSGAGVQKKRVNGFLNDYYDDEGTSIVVVDRLRFR